MTKRLAYPAPARESYRTESGLYATRKWTLQGVRDVLGYGGWFHSSAEFDSRATAKAANVRFLDEELT